MLSKKSIAAMATIASVAQAHYMFVRFSHNGKVEGVLGAGGIRNKTAPFEERWLYNTNYYTRVFNDPTYWADYDNSVRCGRDNMNHTKDTAIIDVNAGDEIEIAHQRSEPGEWLPSFFENCPGGRMACDTRFGQDFNHPGSAVVHLSKVPDRMDVREYNGSGDWVKIYRTGLTYGSNGTYSWPLYGVRNLDIPRITFRIPEQTPAGQYLMRMDVPWSGSINPYVKHGDILTQLYPSCAQLNIKSDSRSAFPKGVQIPQIFSPDVPGMETSWEMSKFQKIDDDYEYPGGPLWDGEKMIVDKPSMSD